MYPFFELPSFTSGMLIALIASFHILPSHLATGAFWFTVSVERDAIRRNRPELLDFLKKYTLFILLFCFVFGSLTGVGIWFSSTVASPRGISGLIHNYVWGWATEWVFFIIEIVTIYTYYYTFGKIGSRTHLRIGWIYAWAAWISMIIITGILSFMLSSGKWIETGGFFDGFFNRTYWPQLFMRTGLMFGIAGLYAIIVASRLDNLDVRKWITRKAAIWGIGGMAAAGFFCAWYLFSLPEAAKALLFEGTLPYLKKLGTVAIGSLAIVTTSFIIFGFMSPWRVNTVTGTILVLVLFAGIGAAEGIREGIRRPYVIDNYLYSNQIVAHDLPAKKVTAETVRFRTDGFLKNLFFVPDQIKDDPGSHPVEAGRIVILFQCGNCHALERGGIIRPLPALISRLGMNSPEELADYLLALESYPFMPPFVGTDEDRLAAGAYLASLVR
ncbi:MAG: cytochrome c [Deltaproteobacteria bacterium]